MPGDNDVVRHVILRIVVDQAGLAESLAKAKDELKALKASEKGINKERGESHDAVTKAIDKQSEALDKNQTANEAAERARGNSSRATAQAHKDATTAINDETKAVRSRSAEDAKARQQEIKAEFDQAARETAAVNRERQNELDREARRQGRVKKDAAGLDLLAAKAKKLQAETDKLDQGKTNLELGGQTDRANKSNQSQAGIKRSDATAAAASDRADDNALAARENKKKESDARIRKIDNDTIANRIAQDKRAADLEETLAKKKEVRDTLHQPALDLSTQKIRDSSTISTANTDRAQSLSEATAIRAADTADAASVNATERRAKSLRAEEKSREDIQRLAAATNVLDQRAAALVEARARAARLEEQRAVSFADRRARSLEQDAQRAAVAAERLALSRRRGTGLIPSAGRVIGSGLQVAGALAFTGLQVAGALTSPRPPSRPSTVDSRDVQLARASKAMADLRRDSGKASASVRAFFENLAAGEGKAAAVLGRLREGFRRVFTAETAGGGGGLTGNFLRNFGDFAERFEGFLKKVGRGLFSFRGLILLAVAAAGPLAAILGAVGAAALGLAADLANLSGVLFALPGIIGAAVAGFGALALVMKPITSVFSAFSAAQKEAATAVAAGSTAAKNAAIAYQEAALALQQAQLNEQRANQDAPRAVLKLADARKQAARDIQDYRLALQKLKYDEEGVSLGVDSAEQEYRRALADPTKNNLDRQIARHNVQGALFDKRDQTVAGGRLKEDAAQAEKRGVEGSDGVIAAERAMQDANIALAQSALDVQKATLAMTKALTEKAAGGTAAAEFKALLDKLPPQTRKVVEAIIGLNGEYKKMRDRLSEKIFGPLAGDTGKFADVLKVLESFLSPAATAMGILADKALKLFTNPDWKKFFSEQGTESGYILGQLGAAALAVADGFRGIVETARPFTRFVVDGILGMATAFDKFATSETGRDKLAHFLAITRQTMTELKPVVTNLVGGFLGFFAALNDSSGPNKGKSFVTRINEGLLEMAKKFKKFGDDARDPNGGFQTWLRNVGPLIKDVVHFVGQAATFFGNLFSNPANLQEAHDLLKAIGEKWLPALAGIFDKLSKAGVISKLASGIGTALHVVDYLFGKVIAVYDWIKNNVPFASGIFTALGAVVLALTTGALSLMLLKLVGIVDLVKLIPKLFKLLKLGPVGILDSIKDKITGRDTGVSAAQRNARKNPTATGGKSTPDLSKTGGVLPTLYRMEEHLLTIIGLMRRGGTLGGGSTGGGTRGGPSGGPTGGGGGGGPRGRRTRRLPGGLINAIEQDIEGLPTVRAGGRTSTVRPQRRSGGLLVNAVEQDIQGLPRIAARPAGSSRPLNPEARETIRRQAPSIRDAVDFGRVTEPTNSRRSTNRRTTSLTPTDVIPIVDRPNDGSPGTGFTRRITSTQEARGVDMARDTVALNAAQAKRQRLGLRNLANNPVVAGAEPELPVTSARSSRYTVSTGGTSYGNLGQYGGGSARRKSTLFENEIPVTPRTFDDFSPRRDSAAAEIAEKPASFRTAKGSTYQVHDDGTTTREKAYRPEHGAAEQGPQPRSQQTFYARPEHAERLSPIQASSPHRRSLQTRGDEVAMRYDEGPHAGKFDQDTRVPIARNPSVGMLPVETWKDGQDVHFGNQVTDVGYHPPASKIVPQRPPLPSFSEQPSLSSSRYGPKSALPGFSEQPTVARTTLGPRIAIGDERPATRAVDEKMGTRGIGPFAPGSYGTKSSTYTRELQRQATVREREVAQASGLPGYSAQPSLSGVPYGPEPARVYKSRAVDAKQGTQGIGPFAPGSYGIKSSTYGRELQRQAKIASTGDEGYADFSAPTSGKFLGIPLPGETARQQREETRQERTAARGTRRGTRSSRRGGGLLGSLFSSALAVGVDDALDGSSGGGLRGTTPIAGGGGGDEYQQGYDDGYNKARRGLGGAGSQGGLGIDPSQLAPNLPDRDGRPRRGEAMDEGEGRPQSRAERRRASRATRGTGGRGGRLSRLFGGAEKLAGREGGSLLGRAGGLGRGLVGGLAGAAVSLLGGVAADYATDKFVKNDQDANSIHRGIGAVSTGAGIGATVGSIIPGLGTVVGGAVGGAIGGAYSLVKDKNLRSFVGGKISGGAKAVGGALKSAGSSIGKFFGFGGDDEDKPGGRGSGSGKFDKKLGGAGGVVAGALGPVGMLLGKTDIGASILGSLTKAGKGISDFFTKTIPGFFSAGVKGITDFFTVTLPSLPGRAFDAFFRAIGRIGAFFTKTLPRFAGMAFDAFFFAVGRVLRFFIKDLPNAAAAAWRGITTFFTKTLPHAAQAAWHGITNFFTKTLPHAAGAAWGFVKTKLWDPFMDFIKGIPGFFTDTIPKWFSSVKHWMDKHINIPIHDFVTKTVPDFFTKTIPKWFEEAPKWFKTHVIDNVTSFFTETLPNFFTVTLPNAIKALPGVLYDNLVTPILEFFKGIAGHIGDFLKGGWSWAKGLFHRASADVSEGYNDTPKKMSGGLVDGIYQGIEDKVHYLLTPDEFVVRRGAVNQPRGKDFLNDFNEGRFDPADWYAGLAQQTAPRSAMSLVPAGAPSFATAPSVVNHTTNAGLSIGDITIHNPVREKSEHSLRRQIQIAAIRHRR